MDFMFEWQEQYLTSERKHKIHIFELPCNVLFISYMDLYSDTIMHNDDKN